MSKRVKLDQVVTHSCCCSKRVGAHISAAGGVFNAFSNNSVVDGKAFACFLKSQRKWTSPPLSDSDVTKFNEKAIEFNFDKKFILPHGSYLINLASPDPEMRAKSFDNFLDDLQRCHRFGISLYNFHPGSTVGKITVNQALEHISESINRVHSLVPNVIVVLETMAGQGNVVGSKFEELRDIITKVEDKSRIGVCIDTCHIFSAGYDIRSRKAYDKTMEKFESTIGFKYLKGVHLNDSKTGFNEGKDRHENIGKGKIGLNTFKYIMNDPRFDNIPMVLETPASENDSTDIYKEEIKLLYSLIENKSEYDVDSKESGNEIAEDESEKERKSMPSSFSSLVNDLLDNNLRENSLAELSKQREQLPDLAVVLWNRFGVVTILIHEIISAYPLLVPPGLNSATSTRVCNALALLQCIASHEATRSAFLQAHIPLYLYPFLNTTSKTRPFEYLRLTSLGVIGALVKSDNSDVIDFLLSTEIIPLCLRIMETGNELSRTVAIFIVQKILLDNIGLGYVCQTYERFHAVVSVLNSMVQQLQEQKSLRLLKHIIRCYLRLTDNKKAMEGLKQILPASLRDGSFKSLMAEDANTTKFYEDLISRLA